MNSTGRRGGVNPLLAGFGAGVAIALVIGVMATINLQFGAPWANTHTVTAQVSDADSMAVGSDVRIAGRLVGQVTAINAAGGHANITFHVDDSEWPLPADTTASVRLATLLGQKYVQLNPGHSSQHMGEHAVIGLGATKPVVDFDQVLNTFDKPTRDSLTSLVRTGAAAVQGEEGTLQQLVPNLSELSVHSRIPTGELVTRDPEFNAILVNLGITADQLNRSRDNLAAVIDNLNTVSAALASTEGVALKSYITNTDALNRTTSTVLAGGNAAALDAGLSQLCTPVKQSACGAGLLGYLDTLMRALIPETAQTGALCTEQQLHGCNPVTDGNPSLHPQAPTTPAQAGIDLIYEIGGSAVSQGDQTTTSGFKTANFFLRQSAQGIDDCGLIPCTAQLVPTPAGAAQKQSPLVPPCIPLVTCAVSPPVVVPPATLPPVPCIPLLNICPSAPTPTPAPKSTNSAQSTPTALPLPSLPLPLPTPSLPIGISYHVAMTDPAADFWPLRYR
jgi:virulence factor Mce-like protein